LVMAVLIGDSQGPTLLTPWGKKLIPYPARNTV
jgi:hypothetical protein